MSKKINVMESVTPTIEVPVLSKDRKQLAKEKLDQYMREETVLVKGIFQNFETPGMATTIQVKKYKDHFFNRTLEDGKEYEIPLYVARHLNGIDVTAEGINGKLGTCSYPVSSYVMDKDGNPLVNFAKRKKRYGFQSLEFAGSI